MEKYELRCVYILLGEIIPISMTHSLFAGDTDYGLQNLANIFQDLNEYVSSINKTVKMADNAIALLKQNNAWDNIPVDFKIVCSQALIFLHTAEVEIKNIRKEMANEIENHHIERLIALYSKAHELNLNYGIIWHKNDDKKNYGEKNFTIIENILYGEVRDSLISMSDISNMASRLRDFVGKKQQSKLDMLELKPNFLGLGLNFNKIIKYFRKK